MSAPQAEGSSAGWFNRSSSNPEDEESILPRHVAPGQRRSIDSTHSDALVGSPSSYNNHHSSPIQIRSVDSDEARERQRTMDVESALLLSRARSATVTRQHQGHSPVFEQNGEMNEYPMLSRREEDEMTLARGEYDTGPSAPGFDYGVDEATIPAHAPEMDPPNPLDPLAAEDDKRFSKPPLYSQPSCREHVDFSAMEEFAKEERVKLGLTAPTNSLGLDEFRRRLQQKQKASAKKAPHLDTSRTAGEGEGTDDQISRTRQRKLSQSQSRPRNRSGKLALFENTPAPNLPSRTTSHGPAVTFDTNSPRAPLPNDSTTDRPFRFSFYSNALSSTIHSRSICELPAEGQTFEHLFYSGNSQPASTTPGPMDSSNALASEQTKYNSASSRKAFSASADEDLNTWWLDVLNPTDEEMRMFAKTFSVHPLTTEDILMEETREKIELFRHYYLVCFRGFDQDPYSPTYLEPVNMYIIVFREGILSFHFQPTPHALNVRRRIKQLKDYISVTSDWISYALIDDITDAFGPLIQSIEYEVDSIDELVLILKDAEQTDMLRRIGTCRKKVMGLLRLMGNKADVVKGLAKRCNENWSVAPKSDIGLYLSDIQDHLITMTQNLNHYEKILSRSHSNYLAQISIEMTEANNKINDVLSKLTAMGTVLIPMNLITGLWGMNVHVPGQDVMHGYTWFGSIVGALVGLAVLGGIVTYRIMSPR